MQALCQCELIDLGKIKVPLSREFYQASCGIEEILRKEMRNKRLLILALTFFLLFSVHGFVLDFLYPVKIERTIDGDTIVIDLQLGLGVVLDDQYIRLYGIDAWENGRFGERRGRRD